MSPETSVFVCLSVCICRSVRGGEMREVAHTSKGLIVILTLEELLICVHNFKCIRRKPRGRHYLQQVLLQHVLADCMFWEPI